MASSIYDVKKDVEELLTEHPRLRDDYDLLYLEVLKKHTTIITAMSAVEFFRYRKQYGFPPFETVRRARQKAQAENPDLKGERVAQREEAEKVYLDFARS